MGIFSWLFGGAGGVKQTPEQIEADRVKNRRIDLVQRLKEDHRFMLETWVGIGNDVDAGRHEAAVKGLAAFKDRLVPHVMMENTYLYKGLEKDCSGEETSLMLIRDMHAEMDAIGKAVVAFTRKYMLLADDSTLMVTFKKDYQEIQTILLDRIKREERDLYVLYKGLD